MKLPRSAYSIFLGTLIVGWACVVDGAVAPPSGLRIISDVYVAVDGVDTNSGTLQKPVASLEAARDLVRRYKQNGKLSTNGCTVWIRGGTYYRNATFTLDAQDSGTQSAPISYRAYANETVILTGALPIKNFTSVSDASTLARLPASARSAVRMADLKPLGIPDYGSLTNRGASRQERVDLRSGYTRPWMVELFFDDQRQQLSRWPNQDKSEEVWAYTVAPVPGTWKENPTDNWFTYREENPSKWALTEEAWVHGMWTYGWSDSYEKVLAIDGGAKKITTDRPGDYGFTADCPYEALNVLEELDQPGEWVIDRANHRIYFWPPAIGINERSALSVLAADFINAVDVSHVTLQNIVFERGRASGISLRRSSNVLVAGCTFRNLGNMGVVVGNSIYNSSADILPVTHNYEGGRSNRVVGCLLHDLGEGGIVLSGGDRTTLEPCGHMALNNYIHHFNVNVRCYRPAVKLDGVGATVSHANIHDSPHHAISFEGNDHVIEYCNIYRVCKDTEDAGVIYSCGRDWRQRGTVIRYNFIHPSREHGIYLDDFTCGVTMHGNILLNVNFPILIGGGRDNTASNNLVIGHSSVGWHVNNRGVTWAASSISGLVNKLKTVNYASAPYATKYPELLSLQADIKRYEADSSSTNLCELAMAKGNRVTGNVFLSAKAYNYNIDTNRIEQAGNLYYRYLSDFSGFTVSPTVQAVRTRILSLKSSSEPMVAGFQQIPRGQIGVYDDSFGLGLGSRTPSYPTLSSRAPFPGQSLSIPGIVQVEDFDEGSEGDACQNPESDDYGNNAWGSGRYRLEAPFYIWGSLESGRRKYLVDAIRVGAWLEYTVNVAQTGVYNMSLVSSSMSGSFHLSLDGKQITPSMTATNATCAVELTEGTHALRLGCDRDGGGRLDYMRFEKAP